MMLFSIATQAQDYIHKKNREILIVKLVEIGTDEIKFKDFDNPDGPLFSIEKEKVSKIELENGDEMIMKTTDSFSDPDYYTDQNKNVIKWSFSSMLFNQLAFSYERSLTPSSSFEAGFGIIGAGFKPETQGVDELTRNPTGVNIRGGYKWKRSPDYYLPKMRYGHLLKGGYIKPEIAISIFGEDVQTFDNTVGKYGIVRETAVSGAFLLNFGKQWIFSDQFAVDWFFGLGYGFTNSTNYDRLNNGGDGGTLGNPTANYGFVITPGIPLAFSAGLSIGYVFGK
jgi:hypothetical protein